MFKYEIMDRVSTISKVLEKSELYDIILQSIRSSGCNYKILKNVGSPLKLLLTYMDKKEVVFIYIWNISHGGKSRSKEEFRIQMKGGGLSIGDSYKTFLLGWFEEEKVFAAWSAFKHRTFGSSPSVQVTKETLHKAAVDGIAFQTKKRGDKQEIAVTFKPSYIMEYIRDIYPQYHQNEINISDNEISAIGNPLDRKIPDDALNRVSRERRKVIREINKNVRDARFRKDIYVLYGGKCAICGLQAKLVEAAHIDPVRSDGSDDLRNGILLCRNHHKAYDSGLLAIDGKYKIRLNKEYAKWLNDNLHGNKLEDFITNSRIGQKISLPKDAKFHPKKEFLIRDCRLKGI